MRQFSSSLLSCSKRENRWILWMILEIFKTWNQIIVEGCLTFPVNLQWFRVLVPCFSATKDCRLIHGTNLDYKKTFFESNFQRLIHPEIILKEFNLTTCKETGEHSLKPEGRRLFTQVKTDQNQEFYNAGGITAELYGRTAKTANIGIAIRQIPKSTYRSWCGKFDSKLKSLFVMTTFRNSIQDETKFYYPCQRFHLMTSWRACTN